MANRPLPLTLPATGLATLVAGLVLGTALALAWQADSAALRPSEWSALIFTVKQAALSAFFATLLAIPTARALFRRRFPGRGAMIALMGAPFLLPTVVAVVGILAVYGRNGLANHVLGSLHLPKVSLFGLHGVVLANVFFNLPLATRILLNGWYAIPAERFRLAQTLSLPPAAQFRHIERPMLCSVLPGAFLVVVLLCMGSFVVSLTLGGGPKATTLELALYQALRFDFDLGRAALIAGLQFAICALVVVLAARVTLAGAMGTGLDRFQTGLAPPGWRQALDVVVLTLAAVFLALPLLAIVGAGVPGLADLTAPIWQAALRSVAIALTSAILATIVGLILSLAVARGTRLARWIEYAAMLPLAASGLVLGTGLFLILRPFTAPEAVALPVTMLVNALIALPFLFRLLLPQAISLHQGYDRLCATLNLTGAAKLRYVTLPRLARPLGLGAGIAAALSMGDLGVIALFAGEGSATLPLMVQRLAGAYRMDQAAAASLLLVALSFSLFFLFDRMGRHAAP